MTARMILAVSLLLSLTPIAAAEEKGTKDEAVAMVKKVIAFQKENGKEKTFAEISNPKGQFVDRDLYVIAYDPNSICLAHGSNPKLIGRDLGGSKDVDGKPYGQERMELMKKSDTAWMDYKYRNPVTNQVEPKSAYLEKADDVIFACGVYGK